MYEGRSEDSEACAYLLVLRADRCVLKARETDPTNHARWTEPPRFDRTVAVSELGCIMCICVVLYVFTALCL